MEKMKVTKDHSNSTSQRESGILHNPEPKLFDHHLVDKHKPYKKSFWVKFMNALFCCNINDK